MKEEKELDLNDPNLDAELEAQEQEKVAEATGGEELNNSVEFEAKSFTEEVKSLKNNPKNRVWPNVGITTITYGKSEDGTNEFVVITLDKPVFVYKAINVDGSNQFKLGKDNKISMSFKTFLSAVKYGGNIKSLAKKFEKLPNTINDIIDGTVIDLVQVPVKKDQDYQQPFTIGKVTKVKNDNIYNYITKITFGDVAMEVKKATTTNIAELYAHI